jgi:hypothetical protein
MKYRVQHPSNVVFLNTASLYRKVSTMSWRMVVFVFCILSLLPPQAVAQD